MSLPLHTLNLANLKRIRMYMTIVESGSFMIAQQKLGLSAANMSISMSALEDHLGAVLCHRGRSGFSLTPEGERIYKASQDLMLAQDRFFTAVGEAKGKLTGELRLGVIDNSVFDNDLNLPNTLSKFRNLAPEVEISLYTMSPSELEQAVLKQELHLGIGVFYERSADLQYQYLCNENLTLYCGKDHPLFRSKVIIKESTLKQYSFVERTYGSTLSRLNKRIELNPSAYTSSLEAAMLLILSGQYIGFLPRYYAQMWVKQKQIKAVLPRKLYINTEVSVLTHLNPENAKMTNTLKELIFN